MTIKTILVPAGGSDTDEEIFETALAAAKPLAAHLDFYHVVVDAGEAAANMPHAGFAMGAGLVNSLTVLRTEEQARLLAARDHVERFCRRHSIPMYDKPQERVEISASWCEEAGDSVPLIIRRARCNDLVVLGRKKHADHLPDNMMERLLLESGRPILVAPDKAARALAGTMMICWKESREAAHAVSAAMPLMRRASRVIVVGVCEDDDGVDGDIAAAVDRLARQMHWHGIHASPQKLMCNGRSVAAVLSSAARDYKVDLMVMGGYSRSRIRELIFGGCTDTFLRSADCAILLSH